MTKEHNENKEAPPKRPLSGFFLYKAEKYPLITAANPNMKVAEITQVIAKEWQTENDEKKASYQANYHAAKATFDQKMKEYISVHGKPIKKQKKVKKNKVDKAEKNRKELNKEKKKGKTVIKEVTNGAAERKQSK